MSRIAQTSLEAYHSIYDVDRRRDAVLGYIRAHPDQCAEQIAVGLRARSLNSVAPRITELLHECEAIYVSGTTKTSSGKTARTYRAREYGVC